MTRRSGSDRRALVDRRDGEAVHGTLLRHDRRRNMRRYEYRRSLMKRRSA